MLKLLISEETNNAPATEVGNGQPDQVSAPVSSMPSIEERRKALQAIKIQKQKEMEALLAEEEALLQAGGSGATLHDLYFSQSCYLMLLAKVIHSREDNSANGY